ncbi:MAG: hypothetical protein MHPSP_000022 [Paramarteilia canceri]
MEIDEEDNSDRSISKNDISIDSEMSLIIQRYSRAYKKRLLFSIKIRKIHDYKKKLESIAKNEKETNRNEKNSQIIISNIFRKYQSFNKQQEKIEDIFSLYNSPVICHLKSLVSANIQSNCFK